MLRKYGFKITVIFSILLFSAVFAYTHSGRTDRYGGHHDRKNGGYHYHNSGTVGRVRPSTPTTPTTSTSTTPTIRDWTSTPGFSFQRGEDLYFPTKLEWLTLQLNAKYNTGFSNLVGMFEQKKGEDTIMIEITYSPDSSVQDRNEMVELMKNAIKIESIRYGWQDWVKVDVKMERFVPSVR